MSAKHIWFLFLCRKCIILHTYTMYGGYGVYSRSRYIHTEEYNKCGRTTDRSTEITNWKYKRRILCCCCFCFFGYFFDFFFRLFFFVFVISGFRFLLMSYAGWQPEHTRLTIAMNKNTQPYTFTHTLHFLIPYTSTIIFFFTLFWLFFILILLDSSPPSILDGFCRSSFGSHSNLN